MAGAVKGRGHAYGESQSTGWPLAKLGPVVARQSSPIASGSAKPPGAVSVAAPATAPRRTRRSQEADRDRAFAFRGYDATNLGRGPELLEHRAYGPVVRAMLDSASALCGDVLGKKVDLAARVLAREPSTLETFVQDIGTIVGMELAQIRLLEEFFDVPVRRRG